MNTFEEKKKQGLLEALLFVKGRSFSTKELESYLDVSNDTLKDLVEKKNLFYKDSFSGITIIEVANGYQLVTAPLFKDILVEVFDQKEKVTFSKSAMEVLTIIAYKQPITKEEIDDIRGVSSTRSINTLLIEKLIWMEMGKEELLDTPFYKTSKKFLEVFHLKDIKELPNPKDIINTSFVSEREEIE